MSRRPEPVGPAGPTADEPGTQSAPEAKRRTRWLAARVLIVQIVTLVALWLLQSNYGG